MAGQLVRIAVLSDWEAAGGTVEGFFSPLPLAAQRARELGAIDVVSLDLVRSSPSWALLAEGKVLRLHFEDGTTLPYRISKLGEVRGADGGLTGKVQAQAPFYDLGLTRVQQVQSNGTVFVDFDLPALTPTEYIQIALGKNSGYETGVGAYWTVGTVDYAEVLPNIAFRGSSPLEVLRAVEAETGGELEFEVIGATEIRVHLRTAVGSAADPLYVRPGRNLTSLEIQPDASRAANRVYPYGQDLEGMRHTMADAAWRITNIVGTTLSLEGSPIAFDDQLNGLYIQPVAGGTPTLISDTELAGQEVTVASVAGLAIGDRVHVRASATGRQLLHLDRPGASIVRAKNIEREDIPAVENLLPNPFLSDWTGGTPDSWSAFGGAVVTELTDPERRRHGTGSARLLCTSAEAGLESDPIDVTPTEAFRHFLGQIALWVTQGVFRFEIVAIDGGAQETVIPEDLGAGGRAYTSIVGAWTDVLAVQDHAADFYDLGIEQVKLRVVADRLDGGQASCDLDAALLMRTSYDQVAFLDGRASNLLWKAANDELIRLAQTPATVSVGLTDLYRLDSSAAPHDAVVLGGTVEVRDPELGTSLSVRVRKVSENLLEPASTSIELSNEPDEVVRRLTAGTGKTRQTGNPEVGGRNTVDGRPRVDMDGVELYLAPGKLSGARSIRYLVSATVISDAQVQASTDVSDSDDPILVHTFTEDREARYLSVAYYPAPGGDGRVGEIHHIGRITYYEQNNPPVITHQVYEGPTPAETSLSFIATDDGDNVAIYHRWWIDGQSIPGFTRAPTSGYVSDPQEVTLDVTKPTSGAEPDTLVEAYAVDDAGNASRVARVRINSSRAAVEYLSDVNETSPSIGHLLIHDGSNYVNRLLAASDIPNLDVSKLTAGILPAIRGGTGRSTFNGQGRLLVSTDASTLTTVAASSAGGYLRSNGSTWVRVSGVPAADINAGTLAGLFTFSSRLTLDHLTEEMLRLRHASSTGSPYISFYQVGSRRAYVQWNNAATALRVAAEYGPVEIWAGVAGSLSLAGTFDANGNFTAEGDVIATVP